MKINFSIGKESLNGYFNIDPSANDNQADKLNIPLNNLDKIIEPAECTEMILNDFLSYVNLNMIDKFFGQLVSFLRHQTILIIKFYDYEELSKLVFKDEIDISEVNRKLFGDTTVKKVSTINLNTVTELISNNGLELISIDLDNDLVTVKAMRP